MPRPTTATKERRRQSRAESRAAILEAADAFLRERSFRELTVDEVMAAAGLSRTIFYRHFDDLADLVLRVMEAVGGELIDASDEMAAAGGDPEALRTGLERVVAFWAEHGPLIGAVADATTYDPAVQSVYDTIFARFIERTEAGLRAGQEAGRIGDLDVRATAEALTCLNERYLLRTLGRTPQADSEVVLQTLTTIWSRVLF